MLETYMTPEQIEKQIQKQQRIDNILSIIKWVAIVAFVVLLALLIITNSSYEEGYSDGKRDAYRLGYYNTDRVRWWTEEYAQGYAIGFQEAMEDIKEGHNNEN